MNDIEEGSQLQSLSDARSQRCNSQHTQIYRNKQTHREKWDIENLVDVIECAGEGGREIEAEAVHMHVLDPVPQRVHDQLQHSVSRNQQEKRLRGGRERERERRDRDLGWRTLSVLPQPV
jgi:hypothetical protein